MNIWKQILAVTTLNLLSLAQRVATSSVVVIGVAGVVGVLISVLAMATGLTGTLLDTGNPARAIVLRTAANNESFSNIDLAWAATIADAPGVRRGPDGKPAESPEAVASANLHRRADDSEAGLTLRGVTEGAFVVHPEWQIVAGRTFKPGLREIVVGIASAAEFKGLGLGDHVTMGDAEWTVVGHFTSHGDAHESDALADARTLMSATNRGAYNAVTVLLNSPDSFAAFKSWLTSNPSLSVDVQRESDYYKQQSQGIARLLYLVSVVVGAIMAVGALFTALNTMYSAVSVRTSEIATLRAIGFGSIGVIVSVLAEALLLSVIGALIGASVAWLLFNGNAISTAGGAGPDSQIVFKLRVAPGLVVLGIVWACAIGLLGGLLPAIRAARLPVATVLRPV